MEIRFFPSISVEFHEHIQRVFDFSRINGHPHLDCFHRFAFEASFDWYFQSSPIPDGAILVGGSGLVVFDLIPRFPIINESGWSVVDQWGMRPITDPRESLLCKLGNLLGMMKSAGESVPESLVVACLACFRGRIQEKPAFPFADVLALDIEDLANPEKVFSSLTKRLEAGSGILASGCAKVLESIYRPFLPTQRRDESGIVLAQLTQGQLASHDGIVTRDRVAVTGPAGSGKTLLALASARRHVRNGRRTLLTCYNRGLAETLASSMGIDNPGDQLAVCNFHDLCRFFCRKASLPFVVPEDDKLKPGFYQNEAPFLLKRAAASVQSLRFDAIVVDEAQDFRPSWWDGLAAVSSMPWERQPISVFFDDRQNVFRGRREKGGMPDLGEPVVISSVCRNTRAIWSKANSYLEIPFVADLSANPEGEEHVECHAGSNDECVRQVIRHLTKWMEGGTGLSDMAILCPSQKSKVFSGLLKQKDIPIITDRTGWLECRGIYLTTWRKFRGMEADSVILAGLTGPGKAAPETRADYYTAVTRARTRIAMFFVSKAWSGRSEVDDGGRANV